jgi:hypothetical protein
MHDRRDEFLLEMYRQMFNDINRHIMVIWQSVGVLVGALAIFSLLEKHVISADIAASIIVLLVAWLYGHLYDAGYWYNRNLVIIANIERQFLKKSDLHDIHYYFGAHRQNNKLIAHLRLQQVLALGLAVLVLLFHFLDRVAPGLKSSFSAFDPQRTLPYLFAVIGLLYARYWKLNRDVAYSEFVQNSPGISVHTPGIKYGAGHGHTKGFWAKAVRWCQKRMRVAARP